MPLMYSLIHVFTNRCGKTSYHVCMLYDTSIGIGGPNNGAQFDKYGLQGCLKYALSYSFE